MTREGGVQSLGPFFAEPAIEFASPMSLFHSGGLGQSGAGSGEKAVPTGSVGRRAKNRYFSTRS
jgi:hypothetical protein